VIGFYLLSCHLIDLTLGRTFCSSPLHSPPTVIDAPRKVKRNIEEEGKAMNTRTRTLQRIKKRASGSPVPKDYKELEERIDEKFSQLQKHMDERLDKIVDALHVLDESIRKVSGRSAWDILHDRARNESCDFAGATFSLQWYWHKGKNTAICYDDFKGHVQRMIEDTCRQARREHWLFQGLVVVSDWHHKGQRQPDGHHKGYNGQDYHIHILTFAKPKTEVLKYMAKWWGDKNLGQYVRYGSFKGTIRYNWSVDYGWYVYLLDNYKGSTKGIGKIITMNTNKYNHHKAGEWISGLFKKTWSAEDWRLFMRPIGTYDRGAADGLVDQYDEFIEFDEGGDTVRNSPT
jgi:hypothetical protein